ncbi:hypothetical protein [Rhizobium croatiense]|uniref:Uncharacterized protein n=1 Tax=Rhizobium croatiense TaxID=2867516 RepID=A0ABS7M6K7_9HYPH|nr:hypothetical protein [Rhizobium croatiense]MBY4631781.1 hypothetical protein [Rhizobium croatiense]
MAVNWRSGGVDPTIAPLSDPDDSSQNEPINRNKGQISFECQPASMTRNHLMKVPGGAMETSGLDKVAYHPQSDRDVGVRRATSIRRQHWLFIRG